MAANLWRRDPSTRLGGALIPFFRHYPAEQSHEVAEDFFEAPAAGGGGITGTGSLIAQAADITGVGVSRSLGAGSLAAQAADITGVGIGRSRGTGLLLAQAAAIAAAGTGRSKSTQAILLAASAAVSGSGSVGGADSGAPELPHFIGLRANVNRLGWLR